MRITCLFGFHRWELYWKKWFDHPVRGYLWQMKMKCALCPKFKTVGNTDGSEFVGDKYDRQD